MNKDEAEILLSLLTEEEKQELLNYIENMDVQSVAC